MRAIELEYLYDVDAEAQLARVLFARCGLSIADRSNDSALTLGTLCSFFFALVFKVLVRSLTHTQTVFSAKVKPMFEGKVPRRDDSYV